MTITVAFTYEHPAHYVAVDVVIFGADSRPDSCDVSVLLIERASAPYAGAWALPGGFVAPDESLDAAAARELEEETGVKGAYLEQLYTFGDPARDPRGRVISVAYYGLVNRSACTVRSSSDAASARWFDISSLPPLGFDHDEIVRKATARLRGKVRYEPVGFNLLPEEFTLAQLHGLYESLLQRPIDLPNFRRAIQRMGLLRECGEMRGVSHRPAKLFKFDEKRYAQLVRRGLNFEV